MICFLIKSSRSSFFLSFTVPCIDRYVAFDSSGPQILPDLCIVVCSVCQNFKRSCSWSSMGLDLNILHNFNEVLSVVLFSRRYLDCKRKTFTTYTCMNLYAFSFLVTVVRGVLSPFLASMKLLSIHTVSNENLPFW